MGASINVQGNLKEIEIQRDGKVVGSIFFDPTDPSIIDRLIKARETLENTPVPSVTDNEPITETIAKMRAADKVVRDAVDYAFAYPCSDVVFGDGYAISTRNGVSKFEQFLDGAWDIIVKSMDEEVKTASKRQAKYLAKYGK